MRILQFLTNTKPQSKKSFITTIQAFSNVQQNNLLDELKTNIDGLSQKEAMSRLQKYGLNKISQDKKLHPIVIFLQKFLSPLTLMLVFLALTSLYLNDTHAAIVIGAMTMISVILSFVQELRSSNAAEKLSKMVSLQASVVRQADSIITIPMQELVIGDIVHLSAGDIIPADIRLLSSKDLFINQAMLTGEALAIEKFATSSAQKIDSIFDIENICFMGSNVQSGTAIGVVVLTSKDTYFGSIAKNLENKQELTSFDIGIKKFTWLMLSFMLVMVPLVMLTNGFLKHNWMEAFIFGLSVAVGLAPEMLPMIVTVNLGKGAIALSKQKVIVKKLSAIQNFGAMDVLCTDKTGTLTQDRIILEHHIDASGVESSHILELAYLNSHYQTGLTNLLDVAVLKRVEFEHMARSKYTKKIDEIPFDFIRKKMSVIVEHDDSSHHLLITKGAAEESIKACTLAEINGEIVGLTDKLREEALQMVHNLNEDGFRVITIAYKSMPDTQTTYSVLDEINLVLAGHIAFLDPPKESAIEALVALKTSGVEVKVLTGDNEVVTKKICKDVGLEIKGIYKGSQIDVMSDDELSNVIENANIFAKLSPDNKARIVKMLKVNGHTVGFLGDGINDALAIRAADVGISVDSAVDIAKETADIILLEKSLMVLERGIYGGRQVFGNIIKYIKMGASSNFGNMFSMLGASVLLPFLPLQPIQILTNNFLYDLSQASTPTDRVDEEFTAKPQKWKIEEIRNFMMIFGPISSVFDYVTFGVMLYVFNANEALFQTGWFIESLISQTLIIHIIRTNKIPFIESTASLPVIIMTTSVMAFGIWLPFSPFANTLGLVKLPLLYWATLIITMFCYLILTQITKHWYIYRFQSKSYLILPSHI